MEKYDILLDATKIQPHARKHEVIFSRFDSLKDGEYFVLHNDHDPVPLNYQFRAIHGDTYDWEYLKQGPSVWEVKITRRLSEGVEPTVGDLVAEDYRRADIFRKHGIDFYSSNIKSLADSCAAVQVDVELVQTEIKKLDESRDRNLNDFNNWELDFLSDYIVYNHHAKTRAITPLLLEFSGKVAEMHSDTNPEVIEIAAKVKTMVEEILQHLETEEKYLFPYVKKLLTAKNNQEKLPKPGFGSLEGPIKNHFEEHDTVINLMEEIKELSSNFKIPETACYTYTRLYQELYEFERDLQQHIHLENNILFGKAIALEEEVVE